MSRMTHPPVSFDDWILALFHPDAEDPMLPPDCALDYLDRLFGDPVEALDGFTDEEIGVGLWSLLDSGGAATAMVLGDERVPVSARASSVWRIHTVYEELFVARCGERLGHCSEQDGRLEMVCYMFWDIAAFGGRAGDHDGEILEDEILGVLTGVLQLEHAACQESAVHGLGHRLTRHPERVPAILEHWLATGSVRDERLGPYARAAVTGCIL
jgi:hypothetical protein